jgi:hypothetical protein
MFVMTNGMVLQAVLQNDATPGILRKTRREVNRIDISTNINTYFRIPCGLPRQQEPHFVKKKKKSHHTPLFFATYFWRVVLTHNDKGFISKHISKI